VGLRARWKPLLAFAALEISVPFPMIALGEQRIDSGLAAIIVATVPLVVALMTLKVDPSERVDRWRLTGMLVGLTGVVLLVGIDVAGNADELVGAACIFVAVVGYAAGPLIINRYFAQIDPRGPVAGALAISTVLLAPAAIVGAPEQTPSGDAILSIVVLGLFSTAAAFVLMFILIGEAGPSRASIITYINPVIAVALGVIVLGEPVGLGAIAGLLLILAGSSLATGGGGPPSGLVAVLGRYRRRRSKPSGSARMSAARAAFAPHAPCTPPPGCADADAR
jgi:drug/metabolite transporter (DMT)-like permease